MIRLIALFVLAGCGVGDVTYFPIMPGRYSVDMYYTRDDWGGIYTGQWREIVWNIGIQDDDQYTLRVDRTDNTFYGEASYDKVEFYHEQYLQDCETPSKVRVTLFPTHYSGYQFCATALMDTFICPNIRLLTIGVGLGSDSFTQTIEDGQLPPECYVPGVIEPY